MPAKKEEVSLLFVDGSCSACNRFARFVAAWSQSSSLRILSLDSALGRRVSEIVLPGNNQLTTAILVQNGNVRLRSQAILGVLGECRFPIGIVARLMLLVPHAFSDLVYSQFARARYFLGRSESCMLPSGRVREMFPKDAMRYKSIIDGLESET